MLVKEAPVSYDIVVTTPRVLLGSHGTDSNSRWVTVTWQGWVRHYNDVITSAMASQIIGVSIVCTVVCSGEDQRKHQSSASLAFVRGIHWWPVNSPQEGPVMRKMFPFDDVLMTSQQTLPGATSQVSFPWELHGMDRKVFNENIEVGRTLFPATTRPQRVDRTVKTQILPVRIFVTSNIDHE